MHLPRPRASTGQPRYGLGPRLHRARQRQHGFTLVELIIAAALIALLAKTATFFWIDGLGLARSVNTDSAAIADGRALLERLTREIREVKYDNVNGAYCVTAMTAAHLAFKKTRPGDTAAAACGSNDIAVDIAPTGATINLAYADAGASATPALSRPLTTYASTFTLAYFKADGVTAATGAGDLRFVQLLLTQQPAGVQATTTRTLVALRNN